MRRWWVIGVLGMLTLHATATPNWHLFFCLPYDNDLAQHAAFIELELARLHISDEVVMTMLVQKPNEPIRFVHFPANRAPQSDTTSHRSFQDGKALEAFLDWSMTKEPRAKRTAFFMLGHGGGLNKMALETSRDTAWMTSLAFADALDKHTQKHGKFDALMLQQCSKATLTELVEFAPYAEWMAASPLPIGAPNYYYADLIDGLQNDLWRKPQQLIRTCLEKDRKIMSKVWTIVKSDQLLRWVDQMEAFVTRVPHDRPNLTGSDRVIYAGTDMWDVREWLRVLTATDNPTDRTSLKALYQVLPGTWVREGTTEPLADLSGMMVARRTESGGFALQKRAPNLWQLLP